MLAARGEKRALFKSFKLRGHFLRVGRLSGRVSIYSFRMLLQLVLYVLDSLFVCGFFDFQH